MYCECSGMENYQQLPCTCPSSQQGDRKICEYHTTTAACIGRKLLRWAGSVSVHCDWFCTVSTQTRSSAIAEKQRVSCPHGWGLSHAVHSPSTPSGYTYAYGRIRNPQQTYVKRVVRKAHFKLNQAFKVIQGYPYLCRQQYRTVYCRNVQLMPTLLLKITKIWQQKHSKFVDFNDPTQVWRRRSKKRLQISTNDLYCHKLELLTYISVADSIGLRSLVFT